MAAKKENITIAVPQKEEKPEEVRVPIMIPTREDDEASGLNVDHYEHVTISNETGEQHVRIQRGKRVEVTIPVFMQLRNRYPNI